MRYFVCLLITLLALSLQSCLPVAIGVAAGAGGTAVYKRKAIKDFINDQRIETEISTAYKDNGLLSKNNHIITSSVNGNVLLVGEIQTAESRSQAAVLAQQAQGVQRVYNELTVSEAISLWRRTKDTAITTKVKSKMLVAPDFDPSHIKVITNNGIVYLIGTVTPKQSDQAAEIASTTSGTKKVVKAFQYIT